MKIRLVLAAVCFVCLSLQAVAEEGSLHFMINGKDAVLLNKILVQAGAEPYTSGDLPYSYTTIYNVVCKPDSCTFDQGDRPTTIRNTKFLAAKMLEIPALKICTNAILCRAEAKVVACAEMLEESDLNQRFVCAIAK